MQRMHKILNLNSSTSYVHRHEGHLVLLGQMRASGTRKRLIRMQPQHNLVHLTEILQNSRENIEN